MKHLFLAIFTSAVHACMSDEKCGGSQCCYMNICMPVDSVECSGTRMDIFRALGDAMMGDKDDVKEVVETIRSRFNLSECDEKQDGCIDYIGIMAEQLNEGREAEPLNLSMKPSR